MKIVLPLPVSINQTYKTGRGNFYTSKEVKEWVDIALWHIKKQWKRKTLKGKVYMHIWWFLKRERDISSGLKLLEDVLEKGKVYENDKQIYQTVMNKGFDRDNPRVEVEVEGILTLPSADERGWYGVPGKPSEVLQKVDIPDLSESLDEMNFLIEMIEKATGATATQQGVQTKKQITLGEIQLALGEAKARIHS